ncbi:ABC transporter permease [Alkalihalobacillus sp. CinArs1]|uniref:ABC transporter permease n=1 Tax=Alkalihalobacillus sp. CinArs1 TaxID=2995314 RepID=UPI0022DE038C|nr:ABC transporter permease [Alkalihalobacillus sp. CinArs1]
MKALSLLRKRIKSDFDYKYRDLRTAIDWTVLLYILIPATVIFIAMYRSWWIEAPEWTASVPEEVALIGLFFFATTLSFRTYVEEADQVFIMGNTELMVTYQKWYTLFSVVRTVGWGIIGLGVLLPLLIVGWGWSVSEVASLASYILLMSVIVTLGKHLLQVTISIVWVKWVMIGLLTTLGVGTVLVLHTVIDREGILVFVCAVLAVILSLLIRVRLTLKGTFFQDVILERGYKQHFTKLFLGPSGSVSKPLIERRRPLLVKGKWIKKNDPVSRILDLYLKWLVRSFDKLQFYLQVVGWSNVAIYLLPLVVKFIVLGFALYALTSLSRSDWKEFSDHQYGKLFQWDEGVRRDAEGKVVKLISMPAFFLLCIVTVGVVWMQVM